MDDENDAQLDVVFKNCRNDFQLFLSTIAKYLGKKQNFSTCDLTHVSQLFANAANTSKTHDNDDSHTDTNGTLIETDKGTSSKVRKPEPILDDDSRDMFETENEDDEIIPETQMFPEESNDSGESVTIPLYSKNNGLSCGSSETSEGADDSEFAQVRPETEVNDHTEQQSQMIMANMDRSILHDIEQSFTETIASKTSNIIISAQTSSIESDLENNETQMDDESNDDGSGDRSAATTPDLVLSVNVCKNIADLADMANANAVDKQPAAEQRENGDGDGDDDDDDMNETQMFSQSIFDANTQAQMNHRRSPEPPSTEDIFMAGTQPVFKMPTAISTPRAKTKQNLTSSKTKDVFDAPTQELPDIYEAATQRNGEDVYDAATQMANNTDDDIFCAATQLQPERNRRAQEEEEDDMYIPETQMPPDEVFEQPTQLMRSEVASTSSKKSVTWKKTDKEITKQHNVSDDLFDVETQVFEAPAPSNDASPASEDLNETEVFDMPTQAFEKPSTSAQNIRKQRIPTVLTQSSQPSNTPEWSMAARISNVQIEQFEKTLAEREAERKREKLRKKRYLFATSEDEDENDDDLELDLVMSNPAERMKETQARGKSNDGLKRPASSTGSDDSDSMPKKSKPSADSVKPAKITSSEMNVKVKLSRKAVDEYMKKDKVDQENRAKKPTAPRETNKNSKTVATKPAAEPAPTEQRNLRRRKSEAETPPSTERSNKRKPTATEEIQPKEKRGKKEPRELAALKRNDPTKTFTTSKTKENEPKSRNAKKDKDKDKAKENDVNPPVMMTHIPDSNLLSSMKRRPSDRQSAQTARSSVGPAIHQILFTKVNSAPYMNAIQKLGGAVVDTPQLGTVLICDKISRTFKFLYALSKGIPIVSPRWLDASAKCGAFEPTDPYIVSDANSEKRFRFSLRKSLEAARRSPLFVNYHVCTTPNVQPITSEIAEIVECAGGKYENSPLKVRRRNSIAVLITHKKDSKMWKSYKEAHPDILIVSSEGFLQSVVQQKINFSDYLLNE